MKAWLSLVSIALVAVWPLQARCEPDATVKWLMDQPVSLFDWGILQLSDLVDERLKIDLEEEELLRRGITVEDTVEDQARLASLAGAEELRKRGITVAAAFARYEWSENRLYIQVTAFKAPVSPEACRFVLDVARNTLVGKEAGKPREERARYFLDEGFTHEGGYPPVPI